MFNCMGEQYMSDITGYFSQQDKIDQLQAEIKKLKTKNATQRKVISRQEKSISTLTGKPRVSRSQKALNLIFDLKGTDKATRIIERVAKECFLTVNYTGILFYKGVIQ